MNTSRVLTHEALFGPPSELISISEFLEDAQAVEALTNAQNIPGDLAGYWGTLSEQERTNVEDECSLADLKSTLDKTLTSPRLFAYLSKVHENRVRTIFQGSDTSTRKKRKRGTDGDGLEAWEENEEVKELKHTLEGVKLRCWQLDQNAGLFIRPPRQGDHNALTDVKHHQFPSSSSPDQDLSPQAVLIFVTAYTSLSWGRRLLSRTSQHVFLGAQSVGDICEMIPCTMRAVFATECRMGTANGTENRVSDTTYVGRGGGVVCIEGVLYGDGINEDDYADRLLNYLEILPEKKHPRSQVELTKGPSMHDVKLSSLSLRLHQPYWYVHAGGCEHFFVVEQVRLHNPSDPPPLSYPLTTQLTHPVLHLCRACGKVPAVYVVSGDVRLGESPFVVCKVCWRWLGVPKGEGGEKVVVVELPKYEECGWGN